MSNDAEKHHSITNHLSIMALIGLRAISNVLRGYSRYDNSRRNILRNGTATCDESISTNSHTACHQSPCRNPAAIIQPDLGRHQVKALLSIIVAACAKIGPLRDANMISNVDRNQIINPRFLANPTMITDGKKPWIFDSYVRFDYHTGADLRAE